MNAFTNYAMKAAQSVINTNQLTVPVQSDNTPLVTAEPVIEKPMQIGVDLNIALNNLVQCGWWTRVTEMVSYVGSVYGCVLQARLTGYTDNNNFKVDIDSNSTFRCILYVENGLFNFVSELK